MTSLYLLPLMPQMGLTFAGAMDLERHLLWHFTDYVIFALGYELVSCPSWPRGWTARVSM